MDRYIQVKFLDSLWDSEKDAQCKPEDDKVALVSIILSTSYPSSSAFLSSPNSTSVKMGKFFSVPAKRCSVPILLQCFCIGSFPEGQCQGCMLSGENTQLATLRNITAEMQSQAQPGKNSCRNGALGSGGQFVRRVSKAPSSICKPQKANTKCRTACSTSYLLLHCSPRIHKIDGLSIASAYSHVLKYSCLWHYFRGTEQCRPQWSLSMAAEKSVVGFQVIGFSGLIFYILRSQNKKH